MRMSANPVGDLAWLSPTRGGQGHARRARRPHPPRPARTRFYADAAGSGASPYTVQSRLLYAGKFTVRCLHGLAVAPLLQARRRVAGGLGALTGGLRHGRGATAAAARGAAGAHRGGEEGQARRQRAAQDGHRPGIHLAVRAVADGRGHAGRGPRAAGARPGGVPARARPAPPLRPHPGAGRAARLAARRDGSFPRRLRRAVLGHVLTVRKLEKHLGGEPLADDTSRAHRRTWTKKTQAHRGPDLVEYASCSASPDGFVCAKAASSTGHGEHFTEKQILRR